MQKGRPLQRIRWTSKDPVRLRRAIVVMMAAQGPDVRAWAVANAVEWVFVPTYGS